MGKFNEKLSPIVYNNAAKRAADYGDTELSDRFKKHVSTIHGFEQDISDEIHLKENNLKPFEFVPIPMSIPNPMPLTGNFLSFDPGMTYDMYIENSVNIQRGWDYDQPAEAKRKNPKEYKGITIPIFFKMQQGELESSFCPFWIESGYDFHNEKTFISGPHNIEDTPWGKYRNEEEEPVLFNNRKDANRFIKFIKERSETDLEKLENVVKKHEYYDNRIFNKFKILYMEVVNSLNVRMIYRSIDK